jgi:hypothetical protein
MIFTCRQYVVVGLVVMTMVVASGCKGKGSPAAPSNQPALLTQEQAVNFAAELARSLIFAGRDCVTRGFNPNSLGTTPVNQSCTATRTCSIGGTIRPSMTATGQMVATTTLASLNLSLSGSQNILNWGCVVNPWVVSGNPTVSLSGQMTATSAGGGGATYRMRQSGQIIYGPVGGGSRSCALDFETTADQNSGNTARINGSICDKSFNQNIVLS